MVVDTAVDLKFAVQKAKISHKQELTSIEVETEKDFKLPFFELNFKLLILWWIQDIGNHREHLNHPVLKNLASVVEVGDTIEAKEDSVTKQVEK